jgi:serine O-acetyltransferase
VFKNIHLQKQTDDIETELIKATEIKNLFLDLLDNEDDRNSIHADIIAVATRHVGLASIALLYHSGLKALVCYRAGHRLWQDGRTGLAYYFQSTVSIKFSADLHPACVIGHGIYLCSAAGVVIGETATVGNDVSILQGVTLGGTGKEDGDRHPKIANGVILHDGATVLGNIPVGEGAVVTAKAIVTKPVPPLGVACGVPAKVISYRTLLEEEMEDDIERHLVYKYLDKWTSLINKSDDLTATL